MFCDAFISSFFLLENILSIVRLFYKMLTFTNEQQINTLCKIEWVARLYQNGMTNFGNLYTSTD